VTIVAHSLGGNICLRYAGIYPEQGAPRLVAIEGLGPSPKVIAERGQKSMAERVREWVDEQRKLSAACRAAIPPSRMHSSACRRRTSISRRGRRGTSRSKASTRMRTAL